MTRLLMKVLQRSQRMTPALRRWLSKPGTFVMTRSPNGVITQPESGQQMDRSNDPKLTEAMDKAAPETAMASRRQQLTGSAVGVGSVGFDEDGAFDVGERAAVKPTPRPKS
jgi:hypothetical protein